MSVDVAVTATAFMDLTFVGLEAIPNLGEERFAGALLRSPGGGAINAIGAARLGLCTALASPLGEDIEGRHIARTLEEEGIAVLTRKGARTATTAVMPWGGERAMVTFDPGLSAEPGDVARFAPRAVIVGLHQLELPPPGATVYATCGDDGAHLFAHDLPLALDGARCLLVNTREGLVLTGAGTPEDVARELGAHVEVAVVTLGPEGALALVGGELVRAPGFDLDPVDTTGAGDLLCSAFVWADLGGADVETALRWAVLYASLSVTVPTGAAGAMGLDRLLQEGSDRGLPPLPEAVLRRSGAPTRASG
jgi:sugar/nucleoside kinase (ribokinase family)